jgi:hypothetical protein
VSPEHSLTPVVPSYFILAQAPIMKFKKTRTIDQSTSPDIVGVAPEHGLTPVASVPVPNLDGGVRAAGQIDTRQLGMPAHSP